MLTHVPDLIDCSPHPQRRDASPLQIDCLEDLGPGTVIEATLEGAVRELEDLRWRESAALGDAANQMRLIGIAGLGRQRRAAQAADKQGNGVVKPR